MLCCRLARHLNAVKSANKAAAEIALAKDSECKKCKDTSSALRAARATNAELTAQLSDSQKEAKNLARMLSGASSGVLAGPELLAQVTKLRKQLHDKGKAVMETVRPRTSSRQPSSTLGTQLSPIIGGGTMDSAGGLTRPHSQESTSSLANAGGKPGASSAPVLLPVSPYMVPNRLIKDPPVPKPPPVYDDGLMHILSGVGGSGDGHVVPSLQVMFGASQLSTAGHSVSNNHDLSGGNIDSQDSTGMDARLLDAGHSPVTVEGSGLIGDDGIDGGQSTIDDVANYGNGHESSIAQFSLDSTFDD